MNRAIYNGPNVDSLLTLADLLELPYSGLVTQARVAEQSYSAYRLPKRSGGVRQIDEPSVGLKQVQRVVLRRILREVIPPSYWYCSVSGRDYVMDSQQHTAKKVLIQADIKDFFPSVASKLVFGVWNEFCGFPIEVSEMLTALTTYRGVLPQGAPTSNDIANLILWDVEPELESYLSAMGFAYSRYLDDISISRSYPATAEELKLVQDKLRIILSLKGLAQNSKKQKVRYGSERMVVHGLNVNRSMPTKPKKDRAKIRAAVRECEVLSVDLGRDSVEYERLYRVAYGRVSEVSRVQKHSAEARKLLDRLDLVKPTPKDLRAGNE